MTLAPRFIAGEKKDNTTVPSGRLNPTPKHTVHRNRSCDVSKTQCILPEMSSACDVHPAFQRMFQANFVELFDK